MVPSMTTPTSGISGTNLRRLASADFSGGVFGYEDIQIVQVHFIYLIDLETLIKIT